MPDIFGMYLQDLKRHYLKLDTEQTRRVAIRVAAGDRQARDLLIRSNLPLVVSIVCNWGTNGALEDRIQDGNMGLIHAAELYEAGRNVKFSTYASYWIKQTIREAIQTRGGTIHLPRYVAAMVSRWIAASKKLSNATPEAIALLARINPKHRTSVLFGAHSFSFEPADSIDTMVEPESDDDKLADTYQRLLSVIDSTLDASVALILKLRYGVDSGVPMMPTEVGRHLGLSQKQVCRKERQGLALVAQTIDDLRLSG